MGGIMRLKNKKTGEIATLTLSTNGEDMIIMGNDMLAHITKLSELKDYEDYEEPKGYWCINEFGTPTEITTTRENIYDKQRKNFGNYFETKEEAELAVRKLKAWKRLKDKGFRFSKWFTRVEGGIQINMEYNKYDGIDLECRNDLDLLFSQEGKNEIDN